MFNAILPKKLPVINGILYWHQRNEILFDIKFVLDVTRNGIPFAFLHAFHSIQNRNTISMKTRSSSLM